MRRAEMARRRRNLSEKRNEEVKVSHLVALPLARPFFWFFGFVSKFFHFPPTSLPLSR